MSTGRNCVLFNLNDYAPLPRRLTAMLIDLAILIGCVSAISSTAAVMVVPPDIMTLTNRAERQRKINQYLRPIQVPVSLGCLGFAVGYHVLGRMLRGGTVGYRIAGIRLVDASGNTPPARALFKRFLLAVPFTLLLGASYLRVNNNPRRQANHDLWSGTWVVRKRAMPIGPAKPAYQTKLFGTMLFTYLDLEPADAPSPDNAQAQTACAS